ncbi:MAG TPA: DUF47 family protein [Chloroflexia bacterium]|nr:DUF47 family protein [Chloroflexia bacterium]
MSWLFPDERRFFDDFSKIAGRLTTLATLLEQALDDPTRLLQLLTTIDSLQRETDEAARELDIHMDSLFVPPMDREDIHLLTTRLGLVGDFIGGTARRVVSLKAMTRREAAVGLARIVVRAVGEIETAVRHIRQSDEVLARCREIKRAEEEGDAAWEAALMDLFSGTPDPVDVIRWKAIYDQLEDTLDACDDVANELETITVKHA